MYKGENEVLELKIVQMFVVSSVGYVVWKHHHHNLNQLRGFDLAVCVCGLVFS